MLVSYCTDQSTWDIVLKLFIEITGSYYAHVLRATLHAIHLEGAHTRAADRIVEYRG
jgi:hypothetical protein